MPLIEDVLAVGLDLQFELRGRPAHYVTSDGNAAPVRAIKGDPQTVDTRGFAGAMREGHAIALLASEVEAEPVNGDRVVFLDTGEVFIVRGPASRTADGLAWWPVRLAPEPPD